MTAAKALFEVTAGVLPGFPMPEYTKSWGYTSDEYEQDRQTPPEEMTIFATRLNEVHEYAKGLSNPAYLNWVKVEWLWV
jgi:hypothetical protein